MTKKDYVMIAKVIAGCKPIQLSPKDAELIYKGELESRLSNAFMMDNPDFDPGKFIAACYPEAETEG